MELFAKFIVVGNGDPAINHAEYVFCYECGEDSVCINEGLLPVGTCLNCGYVNQLENCERCGEWFNRETDSMYDDGGALCRNCLKAPFCPFRRMVTTK